MICTMKLLIQLIILITALKIGSGAKILAVFSTPSKSHMLIFNPIMRELARRGHEITVASSFPSSEPLPSNYRDLDINIENTQYEKNVAFPEFMKHAEIHGEVTITGMLSYIASLNRRSEQALQHPLIENLKQNETFDLVIIGYFFNDFQFGLAAHFKCPLIVITTLRPSTMIRRLTGNPNGVSYVPATFQQHLNMAYFKDRVKNFLYVGMEHLALQATDYFIFNPYYRRNFPENLYPSMDEVRRNISLVLVNSHLSEGIVEPYFPSMVDVGGLHINITAKPLPKDIQEFLDNANDGAIYFSLGSNVRSSDLSIEKRETILRVFGQLKQNVLWKFESDNYIKTPNNVMISKWFPQSSVLNHPNLKLFISHCGLSSVNEAKYFAVPILGIPIFADQPTNLATIKAQGWATSITLPDLNEISFLAAINEHLTNKSYRNRVEKLSQLYRDRANDPLETATYWIEYVIRHNGAKHLQSPAVHMNFIQYHSIDVFAFFAISFYISWKIFKILCRKLYNKLKSKYKRD